MRVCDIVTKPLVSVVSGTSILEGSRLMVEKNLGLLVVVDEKDKSRVVGVVSERDIIKAIVAGRSLSTSVDEIGTRQVVSVGANADVAEAAKAMNQHKIRHVVVLGEDDLVQGVVSMRDLVGERATLRAILQSDEKEVFVGGD